MPVYEQSYRHYEGTMQRRLRWAIVIEQELRVLSKARVFILLILPGLIHCILRLLQVVAYDIVIQDVNNPITPILKGITAIMVNERMFFDFLRLQAPLVFLILLYAGSGMICNDVRNNLMEVYFSKPIRWYDYALGKLLTLTFIGLALTAAPGVFLVLLHNLLAPSMELLKASWWWPAAIMGFSLVIVLPCALGILASSALMRSQNYAAIAVFMVLIANSTLGGVLAGVLQKRNYLLLSFPMTLNRIGQEFFGERRLVFDLRWEWSMTFVAVVCLLSAWVVFHRTRRAEVAA